MRRFISPTPLRLLIVALAALTAALAVVNLGRSLPWTDNIARYWDDAALIQGIQNHGFPSGESVITGEYAILKFGYALPYWCLYHWTSVDPGLALGLSWFLIMLMAPLFSPVFRIGGRLSMPGWLVWVAAMTSFPIVHKYIGMANPTIQSMGLWLLLALFYGGPTVRQRGWTIVPGVLCGMIVLTDYKWLAFCTLSVLAIEVSELWVARSAPGRLVSRENVFVLSRRVGLTLLWMCGVVSIAAILNTAYLESIIKYATGPGRIDAFRPALSWNLLIFLWVLGGFWAIAWTAWRMWAASSDPSHGQGDGADTVRRLLIIGVVITVGFTTLFWPRSVRMFVPAIVIGLLLFARSAGGLVSELLIDSMRARIAAVLLIPVLAGMAVRAGTAGDYYRIDDGVREMADYIHLHPERNPSHQIGCYVPPVFRVAVGGAHEWLFLPSELPATLDWAITSEVLDRVIIDEQYLFGIKPWSWRSRSYEIRENLGRSGPAEISIRNDFYASPYYLCESNYSDAELTFILDQAAKVENPTWDLRYVGVLFGRAAPEVPRP